MALGEKVAKGHSHQPELEGRRPLRLAINATSLMSPLTGIGHYTFSLCQHMSALGLADIRYFYGYRWSAELEASAATIRSTHWIRRVMSALPASRGVIKNLQAYQFSNGAKVMKPDLYHEPAFLPFRFKGPTVLTIHDLSWIHFPEAHPPARVRHLEREMTRQTLHACHLITDSEFVRSEVIHLFNVPADRVSAIHLASDPIFFPRTATQVESVLESWQLEYDRYWLSVGTLEPRKNLHRLLDAFSQLSNAERRACPLVIVGGLGWGYGDLLKRIERLAASGEIRYLGYMSRQLQAALMSGAKALIYPSRYEGFGLPLVEAMQSGTPVIASNAACLPEVLGTAGSVFEPDDVDTLTAHLRRLLEDEQFARMLSRRGLERSRAFSWSQCARQTHRVYEDAVSGR